MTEKKRSTIPLHRIADHWRDSTELPDAKFRYIGLGEPSCFRCGWLPPVPDAGTLLAQNPGWLTDRAYRQVWLHAGRYLDRAHLIDWRETQDDSLDNFVLLCHYPCPDLMRSCVLGAFRTGSIVSRVRRVASPFDRSAAAFFAFFAFTDSTCSPVSAFVRSRETPGWSPFFKAASWRSLASATTYLYRGTRSMDHVARSMDQPDQTPLDQRPGLWTTREDSMTETITHTTTITGTPEAVARLLELAQQIGATVDQDPAEMPDNVTPIRPRDVEAIR